MNFASDNWAGAAPRVSDAIARENGGFARSYGKDELTQRVEARFAEIFEHEVAVFFTSTGTAANSLALASVMKPGGFLLCHQDAHVQTDEAGGPAFLSGGRLKPLDGRHGKIAVPALEAALKAMDPPDLHHGRPVAVGLTQATEWGTVYQPDEIAAISGLARARGLKLLMDGARFANALVALGATPAEMSWKAGVDILSFGATKNGCWCAEAVLLFDRAGAEDFAFLQKRSGQLFSKSRFVSAQFDGYFEDDGWLKDAAHANRMARRLADVLRQIPDVRLVLAPEVNEVFAVWPDEMSARLRAGGARFSNWDAGCLTASERPGPGRSVLRLVTSFATTEADIEDFAALLKA